MNLKAIIGVEGVSQVESARAIQVGRYFSYAVFAALLVVVVQLVLDYADRGRDSIWISALVWAVFASELVVNLWLVRDKKRYLLHNWLNVLIVILVFPWIDYGGNWAAIFRALRLLLFLRVMSDVFIDVVALLKRNNFGVVLVVYVVFVVMSGAIFAALEDTTFSNGVWYSLVTVTTIGYGDVVPVTEKGRAFGTVLIVFGVVLFSLVTANISAFLIGAEQKEREKEILKNVKLLQSHLDKQTEMSKAHIDEVLQKVSESVEEVERRMKVFHTENIGHGLDKLDVKRREEHDNLLHQIRRENERTLAEVKSLVDDLKKDKKIQ
jgi:voltage-gated potassium channel